MQPLQGQPLQGQSSQSQQQLASPQTSVDHRHDPSPPARSLFRAILPKPPPSANSLNKRRRLESNEEEEELANTLSPKDLRKTFWTNPASLSLVDWVSVHDNYKSLNVVRPTQGQRRIDVRTRIAAHINSLHPEANWTEETVKSKLQYLRKQYQKAKALFIKADKGNSNSSSSNFSTLRDSALSICPAFEKLDRVYSATSLPVEPSPLSQSTAFVNLETSDSNDDDGDDNDNDDDGADDDYEVGTSILEANNEDDGRVQTAIIKASVAGKKAKERKKPNDAELLKKLLDIFQEERKQWEDRKIEERLWVNERRALIANRENAVCHREHLLFSREVDLYSRQKEMETQKNIEEDRYRLKWRQMEEEKDQYVERCYKEKEEYVKRCYKEKEDYVKEYEKEKKEYVERYEKEKKEYVERYEKEKKEYMERYEKEKKEYMEECCKEKERYVEMCREDE